jgi:hypothetical protein|uniref:Uncharacterized protein n=2 Tax=Sipha flava TaxID=143950 RepID=A0A2S2R6Z0_9HEMI
MVTGYPMIIDESSRKNSCHVESNNLEKDHMIDTETNITDTNNDLLNVLREQITKSIVESIVEITDVTEIEFNVNGIPQEEQYTQKEIKNPNSQTEYDKPQKTSAMLGPVNYKINRMNSNPKTDCKTFFDRSLLGIDLFVKPFLTGAVWE